MPGFIAIPFSGLQIIDGLRYGSTESPYELRYCKGDDKSGLTLAYMILLFLSPQMMWAPGYSSSNDLSTATNQFLMDHTALQQLKRRSRGL